MRQVFDLLIILLEEPSKGALLFLPDVHIIGYLEGGFNVGRKDGIETCFLVFVVHDRLVLSISARILGVDGVLKLPVLSRSELSEIPPVIESSLIIRWHFSGSQDGSLHSLKLSLRDALVHLNKAR